MTATLRARDLLIEALRARIAKLQRQRFGSNSEKIEREIAQLELALEDLQVAAVEGGMDVDADGDASDGAIETDAPTEPPEPRRRPRVAEGTPRERRMPDPGASCPDCGGDLRMVGEDVSELLDLIAAQLKMIEIVRRDCQGSCAGAGFIRLARDRSPKVMANWVRASTHSRGGRFQSAAARCGTRYGSFVAASSEGKCPRARTARRSFGFGASMAFVVQTIRRTASGKAKNGITRSRFRRQAGATAGPFAPQGPASNASSAARPASASRARQMARNSGTTALRSFQGMKSREWRTRWSEEGQQTVQWTVCPTNAGLDDGPGKDGVDGFGEALRSVGDGDQDVGDAASLQPVHHPQPEPGPFRLQGPEPQALARAIRKNAQGDVDGLVPHGAFVPDPHPDRVEEHQRAAGVERATLPFGHLLQDRARHRRDEVRRYVDPVESLEMVADRPRAHATRVHGARTWTRPCRRSQGSAAGTWRSAADRTSPPDRGGCPGALWTRPSAPSWTTIRCAGSVAGVPPPRRASLPDARPARRSECARTAPSSDRPAARHGRTARTGRAPPEVGPECPCRWPCDDPFDPPP